MKSRTSRAVIAGRIVSGLAIAFLLFSSLLKFFAHDEVRESLAELGFPTDLGITLGVLELSCTILCFVPATARLGAIVMTGYLGGAVATHLRLSHPLATHTLFPVWVGALVWIGLLLRDPALRAVLLRPRLRTVPSGI